MRSSRWATRRTCPATTCWPPGSTTPRSPRRRSTWSRSATHRSSPGWPVASPSASRSWPSSGAGLQAVSARVPRTRRPPLRRPWGSTRSSRRPGSSRAAARSRWAGPRCCWPNNRCPTGRRVAIVSNAGGLGVLAADAADAAGLVVPELSADLRSELDGHVAGTTGTSNPVDLGAGASADNLAGVLEPLLASDEVDALLVVVVPTSVAPAEPLLEATARIRALHPDKPVVLVGLGGLREQVPGVTVFHAVDDAIEAHRACGPVRRVAAYAARRAGAARPGSGGGRPGGRERVRRAPRRRYRLGGRRRGEAAPGALRTDAGGNARRQPAGGTGGRPRSSATRSRSRSPTRTSCTRPTGAWCGSAFGRRPRSPLPWTPSAPSSAARTCPSWSSRSSRASRSLSASFATPVSARSSWWLPAGSRPASSRTERSCSRRSAGGTPHRAIRSLRIWPLLDGYRGAEPVDTDSLEQLLVALGELAVDIPELAELDFNPVMCTPTGTVLVDVKVRLAAGRPARRGCSPPAPSPDVTPIRRSARSSRA